MLLDGHEDSIKLPEVHPAICSSTIQPIFAYPSYTWQVAKYSIIYPTQLAFSQCSIEPALPTGLMIDYYSCTISGIPTQAPFQHEESVYCQLSAITDHAFFTVCTTMKKLK